MGINVLRRTWKVALPVVAACAVGIAYQGQAHASGPVGPVPIFSATDLADGLLFNNGPVAPYLAPLNRPAPVQTPSRAATAPSPVAVTENGVNAALNADPTTAATFQSEVQSGDASQVQDALTLLGNITINVLTKQYGQAAVAQAASTVINGVAGKNLIQAIDTFNEFANYAGDSEEGNVALVLVSVVAVVAVVAAIAVAVVVFPAQPPAGSAATTTLDLARDIMIGDVAIDLQATTF